MSRKNEYKSTGGSFSKPSDALSSIDKLLEDVKNEEKEEGEGTPKKRGFRTVISELQNEISGCIAELMKSWDELELDPLYIYSIEDISPKQYARNIKFIHPEYEHVWLTEGKGANVAEELIPFIDYGVVYDYKKNKVSVLNLTLDTKLNLPDFKTSREAAQVDLEILKQDAKRVELVCKNGDAAHGKLSETLTKYCNDHEIELKIEAEIIPHVESSEERAQRLQNEAEAARRDAEEEKRKAEEKQRAAKKKAQDEERKKKVEEAKAARKARAEKEAEQAKAKAREKLSAVPNGRPSEIPSERPSERPSVRPSAIPPERPSVFPVVGRRPSSMPPPPLPRVAHSSMPPAPPRAKRQ
jgi:chemotaxis protein histidine kinase CheA